MANKQIEYIPHLEKLLVDSSFVFGRSLPGDCLLVPERLHRRPRGDVLIETQPTEMVDILRRETNNHVTSRVRDTLHNSTINERFTRLQNRRSMEKIDLLFSVQQ